MSEGGLHGECEREDVLTAAHCTEDMDYLNHNQTILIQTVLSHPISFFFLRFFGDIFCL